jgi:hypothetical protein
MEAPKSPALPRLRKHIQTIDEVIDSGVDVTFGDAILPEAFLVDVRDALDWTLTFLENRRDYHRKRQTQQKIEMALLEEKLASAGIDVRKLKSDAVRLAEDAIIDSED